MDALLMCGGRGTRLAEIDTASEKPLVEVRGKPMIDRTVEALDGSRIARIRPVLSPSVPGTAARLNDITSLFSTPIEPLDAPGEGYVGDLDYALDRIEPPVLTVVCDLPLLDSVTIDRVLASYSGSGSLSVCAPAALKRRLGVSTDSTWTPDDRELAPTGLNVVDTIDPTDSSNSASPEPRFVSYNARLAVNVNRPADLAVAEALCE